MEALNIKNNEKFLRQISTPVKDNDPKLKEDISKVKEYLSTHENVFALAPVQIGIPKRFIYLRHTDLYNTEKLIDEEKILINPVIIKQTGLTTFWEACASCLDLTGLVKRPYKITVTYQDINGQKHKTILKGPEATVFAHEYDHLNGILHIDIADKIIEANFEKRVILRKKEPYKIINKTIPFKNKN